MMLIAMILVSCFSTEPSGVQIDEQPVQEGVTVVQEDVKVEVIDQASEPSEDDLEYARSVAGLEGEISFDLFQSDKNEILAIIAKLDESMRNRDYQLWRSYLTPSSISYWSNRMNLQVLSTRLPGDNVVLRDLPQYFTYMFIPSRIGREVTEIRYDSPVAVKAVQVDGNVDLVYYDFVKENGKWLVQLQRL